MQNLNDEVRCGYFLYFPKKTIFLFYRRMVLVILKHEVVKHQAVQWENTFFEKIFKEPEKEKRFRKKTLSPACAGTICDMPPECDMPTLAT